LEAELREKERQLECYQEKRWNVQSEELRIEQRIGQGNFGVVDRGTWRGFHVAIKQLHSPQPSTSGVQTRSWQELTILQFVLSLSPL